jgi:phosphoribosylanthranilate isomerase
MTFMTWVKICGITNLEDAQTAVAAGADALGFVFYEKSPRNIDPGAAREVVSKLPEKVEKVGVFVAGSDVEWDDIFCHVGLTAVQHQFSFAPKAPQGSPKAVCISSFPRKPRFFVSLPVSPFLGDEQALKSLAADFAHLRPEVPGRPPVSDEVFDTFFLDSGSQQHPGGTGQPFDWEKAVPIAEAMRQGGLKLVVAGGLTPSNVAEAIRILKPWGVDVSSGVEERPGKKDAEKVRSFIAAVRQIEKND